ncbi:MAG TPA: hypothetical protein VGH52_09845 [Gaiellaceae bacterium]|jgi:hypothetical protein
MQGKLVGLLLCALAVVVVAVGSASAASSSKPVFCHLGQLSTKAKPCKTNPAFGKAACRAFEPAVSAVAGVPVVAGPNRAGGLPELSCYFSIAGKTQQFSFRVFKQIPSRHQDQPVKDGYAAELKNVQDEAAQTQSGCIANNASVPYNAPVALSGVGDAAFEWDECPADIPVGVSQVEVLKGTLLYGAEATHPASATRAGALLAFVRQLMAKYH